MKSTKLQTLCTEHLVGSEDTRHYVELLNKYVCTASKKSYWRQHFKLLCHYNLPAQILIFAPAVGAPWPCLISGTDYFTLLYIIRLLSFKLHCHHFF